SASSMSVRPLPLTPTVRLTSPIIARPQRAADRGHSPTSLVAFGEPAREVSCEMPSETPRTISPEAENGLAVNVLLPGMVGDPHHRFSPHFATLRTMVSSRIAGFRSGRAMQPFRCGLGSLTYSADPDSRYSKLMVPAYPTQTE